MRCKNWRKIYIQLLFFTLMIGCLNVKADIVITSLEVKSGNQWNPYNKDYKVTWKRIPGPRDDEVIPSDLPPRYFYGLWASLKADSFFCTPDSYNGYFPGVPPLACIRIYKGYTWRTAEDLFIAANGDTGPAYISINSRNEYLDSTCVAFGAGVNASTFRSQIVNNGNVVFTCAPRTTDPRCYVESDIVLDFGAVNVGNSINKKITKTAYINCELAANVRLNDARGNKGIIEFPWGKAMTKINNKVLPLDINAGLGRTAITVEAEITGIPNVIGDYSGSYPLIIGYY